MKYRSLFGWLMYSVFMLMLFIYIFNHRYYLIELFKEDTSSSTEDVIVWHDRGLEAAIKSAMELSLEDDVEISYANEWRGEIVTSYGGNYLILEGEDIQSLEDLKYFTNLRNLVLKDINVSDLSPLLFLTKLDVLKIYGGSMENLDVVGKMESLSMLDLYDIPVSSIEPLEKMNNLEFLSLGGLSIDDISVLGSMGKLYQLVLERLPLTDISVLKYLKNLNDLEIIDVPVEKIPPLTDALELLTLTRTNISDISGLPESLRVVVLQGNQIFDFSPLCLLPNLTNLNIIEADLSNQNSPLSFQKLQFLSIINCKLSDISLLGNCEKLDMLALDNNELESISGINKLTSLNSLFLSNNKLQRIDGLETIPYLTWLDLSNNPIQDLTPLAGIHSLKRLELSDIDLKDIQLDELLDLPDLEALLLNNCGLKDIKFMKKFPSVHGLHISKNQISDISELSNMNTSLSIDEVVLDLSYNPISDLTPLGNCEKFSDLYLSGIDLKNMEGLEALRKPYIQNLTAENCNLDSLDSMKSVQISLSVANNQLTELSLNDGLDVIELDASNNFISDEYLKEVGAFKVSPGRYKYGQYMIINIDEK